MLRRINHVIKLMGLGYLIGSLLVIVYYLIRDPNYIKNVIELRALENQRKLEVRLAKIDKAHEDALVAQFMKGNPEIFN